jgi:hypothetical protein
MAVNLPVRSISAKLIEQAARGLDLDQGRKGEKP